MFLKKTPIVDIGNETLLKIIYSMMSFTDQEIQELKEARALLPTYKIDTSKTKKLKKERENSATKSAGGGNSGTQSTINDPELLTTPKSGNPIMDALKHQINTPNKDKKGILSGLFKRPSSKDKSMQNSEECKKQFEVKVQNY